LVAALKEEEEFQVDCGRNLGIGMEWNSTVHVDVDVGSTSKYSYYLLGLHYNFNLQSHSSIEMEYQISGYV